MSSQDQTTKDQTTAVDQSLGTRTLWETLMRTGGCSLFFQAARAAGLEGVLKGPDLLTVFAPNDEALTEPSINLGEENPEQARELLSRHMVRGSLKAADLNTSVSLKTLDGVEMPVKLENSVAEFGGARVIQGDIVCVNGVLHKVDRIASPRPS